MPYSVFLVRKVNTKPQKYQYFHIFVLNLAIPHYPDLTVLWSWSNKIFVLRWKHNNQYPRGRRAPATKQSWNSRIFHLTEATKINEAKIISQCVHRLRKQCLQQYLDHWRPQQVKDMAVTQLEQGRKWWHCAELKLGSRTQEPGCEGDPSWGWL